MTKKKFKSFRIISLHSILNSIGMESVRSPEIKKRQEKTVYYIHARHNNNRPNGKTSTNSIYIDRCSSNSFI